MLLFSELSAQPQRLRNNRTINSFQLDSYFYRVYTQRNSPPIIRRDIIDRNSHFKKSYYWNKTPLRQIKTNYIDNSNDRTDRTDYVAENNSLRSLDLLLKHKQNRSQEMIRSYKDRVRKYENEIRIYKRMPFSIAIKESRVKYKLLLIQRMYTYINYLNNVSGHIENGLDEVEYLSEISALDKEMSDDFSDEEIKKMISLIEEVISEKGKDDQEYSVQINDDELVGLETIYNKIINSQ